MSPNIVSNLIHTPLGPFYMFNLLSLNQISADTLQLNLSTKLMNLFDEY